MLLVLQHLRRQAVEAEHIGELAALRPAHIRVDNLVSGQQKVLNLLRGEVDVDFSGSEIGLQQLDNLRDIFFQHGAQSWEHILLRELILGNKASHSCLGRLGDEFDLGKLLDIKASVPVSGPSDRSGDFGARCVDCLPDVIEVDATGDFFD